MRRLFWPGSVRRLAFIKVSQLEPGHAIAHAERCAAADLPATGHGLPGSRLRHRRLVLIGTIAATGFRRRDGRNGVPRENSRGAERRSARLGLELAGPGVHRYTTEAAADLILHLNKTQYRNNL